MAAENRNARKSQTRKSKRTALNFLQWAIISLFFVFLAGVACDRTIHFLNHTSLFIIKDISTTPSLEFLKSWYLSRLKGRSIFSVDLKMVQRQVKSQYPEVDQLRILRRFPDKIYVLAKRRDPFAFMAVDNQDVVLDNEGVVVSFRPAPQLQLPIIGGVKAEKKIVLGKPLRGRDVETALDILREMGTNMYLTPYKVMSVDVDNLSKINCQLSNDIKVIMDRDEIPQKVRKLGILLSEGNLDFKTINYIDLRFKEPILGKKEESAG